MIKDYNYGQKKIEETWLALEEFVINRDFKNSQKFIMIIKWLHKKYSIDF